MQTFSYHCFQYLSGFVKFITNKQSIGIDFDLKDVGELKDLKKINYSYLTKPYSKSAIVDEQFKKFSTKVVKVQREPGQVKVSASLSL